MSPTDSPAAPLIRPQEIFDLVAADPRRYAPVAGALADRARAGKRHDDLVLALRAQAWGARATYAVQRAERLLDEAARIARRHGEPAALAMVLASRAAVRQELGRTGAAQRDLSTAASLPGSDPAAELEVRFQQAVLFQNVGRIDEAAALYRQVIHTEPAPSRVRAIAANNLAIVLSQHGSHRQALRLLGDARPASRQAGPAVAALVAQTSAWATVQAGLLPDGMRMFDEAVAAHRLAGLPLAEHYVEYADALIDLRLLPEARTVAARAAGQPDLPPLMRAEAWLRVAELAVLSGDPDRAVGAASRAVQVFRAQRRPAWTDRARTTLVEARIRAGTATVDDLRVLRGAAARMERRGLTAQAVGAHLAAGRLGLSLGAGGRRSLDRAAVLARPAPVLTRLKGRVAAAIAARDRGAVAASRQECSRGLRDLSHHRSLLPSMELRALASGHGVELGRIGLELSLDGGPPDRALAWMERTRAAALIRLEPAGPAGSPDPAEPAPPAAAAGPAGPAELRRALDGRVLVEYGRVGDALVAVVLERRRCRLVRLGSLEAARGVLDAVLFALRRLTARRDDRSTAAARLSLRVNLARLRRLLLEPVGVDPEGELVVVPIGPLHGVPWGALHSGPLSLAPSATFWARSGHARSPAGAGVLVAAGPDLPGAVDEVRAVRAVHPGSRLLAPPQSTVGAVLAALRGSGLAHLACHGTLRSDNPMFSALELSDGSLTVQQLDAGDAAPHRVVLAACEAGAAVSYPGEELIGFVSALMARGTAGVIAAHAAVPDAATATLMPAVHHQVASGRTLAQALHAARAVLDPDDPRDLVTAAAFSAYGAA